MFYGTLSVEQKEWIAKRLEKSAFKAELVLPERKRRHNDAIAAVNLIQKGAQPLQTLKMFGKIISNPQIQSMQIIVNKC